MKPFSGSRGSKSITNEWKEYGVGGVDGVAETAGQGEMMAP
jgi:hypothetical protein